MTVVSGLQSMAIILLYLTDSVPGPPFLLALNAVWTLLMTDIHLKTTSQLTHGHLGRLPTHLPSPISHLPSLSSPAKRLTGYSSQYRRRLLTANDIDRPPAHHDLAIALSPPFQFD